MQPRSPALFKGFSPSPLGRGPGRGAVFSALVLLLASACVRRPIVKGAGDPDIGVQVVWHGHACFTVEDSVDRRLFIDPFDETVGYRVVWNDPDAVLISDDHFDHAGLRRTGRYDLVDSTGTHTVAGIEVLGVAADHDDEGGRRHGRTRLFVWEMGGLRFAHLGGIGQKTLRPEQKEALGKVDVLFIPVGGHVTLDGPSAAALVKEINPRIAVPMHYGTEKVRYYEFDGAQPFLDQFDDILELPDNRFQAGRTSLPEKTTIYLPALPE
jgi:L-ascorbate metabolism protein UlaG (beta-lactamase superfamily)